MGYLEQTVALGEPGTSEFCLTKDRRIERTGRVPSRSDCLESSVLRKVRNFPKNEKEGVGQHQIGHR